MVDIIITSLETLKAYDLTTSAHLFTLDELQNVSLAQGEEKVDITGKQGRKLSSLKRNKTFTISGSNGLISAGLLAKQVGSSPVDENHEVDWMETLKVTSHKATTSYKAIGTAGAEITALYTLTAGSSAQTALEQDTTAAAGKFAYDPATKQLTFHTDVADNTEIVVYYRRRIAGTVVTNQSDAYSGKAELFIDAMGEDRCANVYHLQFHVPKADFSGEFTLDLGDDQTVQNFEAEGLAGACGSSGQLWDLVIFGQDAADVT